MGNLVTSADQRRGGSGDDLKGANTVKSSSSSCMDTCCGKKKRDQISVEDVSKFAESGDIILFDTRGAIQDWKWLMRTPYNHIGIVIETGYWPESKWRPGKKILMKAVRPSVMEDELEPSIRWISHARYSEESDESLMRLMTYRKLVYPTERTQEVKSRIEQLANEFHGRGYEDSFGEIAEAVVKQDLEACFCGPTKASDGLPFGVPDGEEEQERRLQHVFCSELVAAIFIKSNVMDRGLFANRYLPHDFSNYSNAKANSHFEPGCYLSQEELEVVGHSTDEVWCSSDIAKGMATVRKSQELTTYPMCGAEMCGRGNDEVIRLSMADLDAKFESANGDHGRPQGITPGGPGNKTPAAARVHTDSGETAPSQETESSRHFRRCCD